MNKRKLNNPIRNLTNDNTPMNTRNPTCSSKRMSPISNDNLSLRYIPPKPWKTGTDPIRIHMKLGNPSSNSDHPYCPV
jgi:hypothetical protein